MRARARATPKSKRADPKTSYDLRHEKSSKFHFFSKSKGIPLQTLKTFHFSNRRRHRNPKTRITHFRKRITHFRTRITHFEMGNPFPEMGNPFPEMGNPFLEMGNPFPEMGDPSLAALHVIICTSYDSR